MNCATCRFFVVWPDEHQNMEGKVIGACHRLPPVISTLPHPVSGSWGFVWPSTATDEWCGEWREKS